MVEALRAAFADTDATVATRRPGDPARLAAPQGVGEDVGTDIPFSERTGPIADLHRSLEQRLRAQNATDPVAWIERLSRLAGPVAFVASLGALASWLVLS